MPGLSIIIDWFLPAYQAGGPIISVQNIADHLKGQLNINILCSNHDLDKSIIDVPVNTWIRKSGYSVFYTNKKFREIKKNIDTKNLVFINGMYSLHYSFLPSLFLKQRKILSARGMLDPGGLAQKRLKKSLYLQLWKLFGLHRKCEYHATTEKEKENIQLVFGMKTKIWIAPNLPRSIPVRKMPGKKENSIILCTVALISTMKNHLLVLQSLQYCTVNIEYHIYGSVKDKHYWKECMAVIADLPSNIKIFCHGNINPAYVADALSQCHVYIQPSKSENFGHSLFEALSAGRPIITSCFTPWNELEYNKAGKNVSINSTIDITAAINFFAEMNTDQLQLWSINARSFASKSLDIEKIKQQYIEMFTGIEQKNSE